MNDKRKKILIIASEFPPRGVGNVLRTVKLVKHLPSFGWQPYVLTISLRSIEIFDHSYDSEISEGTPVIRAPYPNPFTLLDRRWHRKSAEQKEAAKYKNGDQGGKSEVNADTRASKFSPKAIAKRFILPLIGYLRKNLFIPGWMVVWLPFAVTKGVRACYRYRIDVIYSTVPSYENHLAALLIKLITKRRWMADYRDLWTDYPTRKISSDFRKKVEESMESLVLRYADSVNIVSPRWREFLLSKFNFLSPEKVTCYTNGFDAEDYSIPPETVSAKPDLWRITYAGSVLRGYPTPLFLRALGELCEDMPDMKEALRVDFCGFIYEEQLSQIHNALESFSLKDNVFINGRLPRQDALRLMENSDLLLLMYIEGHKNTDGCIPAKIFEYIGIQKMVFAIAPKSGSVAEIIRMGNIGVTASPSSYDEIKESLKNLYLGHRSSENQFRPNRDYLEQFDRRYIVGKMAGIFDHLASRSGDI